MKPLVSRSSRIVAAAAAFAAGVSGAGMPALASAPILIWPIDPVIEADRGAGALWLENRGTAPAVMQIRVFRWTQTNGEDYYEEQQDVEASPPMARIQPGVRQLIRLTSNRAARRPGEGAYRIVVDEVPVRPTAQQAAAAQPDSDSNGAPHAVGVRFQMRYSIPLFVYAPSSDGSQLSRKSALQLRCSLADDEGQKWVRISNDGNTHARLVDVAFNVKGERVHLAAGLLGYALPGNTVSRPLPAGATGRETLSMTAADGKRVSIPGCAD